MATESGGLSQEEFLLLQEQLLQLRNQNYELREEIRKTKSASVNSPKNEALQFASKLINRASKSTSDKEKDGEIDGLRRKLEIQEEEFRLQQNTLLEELKTLSVQNEQLKTQISSYSDHPLEKEAGSDLQNSKISALEKENEQLKEERELLCQETIPALNKKLENVREEFEDCRSLNEQLENRLLSQSDQIRNDEVEKKSLADRNAILKQKLEELEVENQKNLGLLNNLETLKTENSKLIEEKSKLTEEIAEFQQKTNNLTSEISLLKESNSKLTEKNQEISNIHGKLTVNFSKLSEDFENTKLQLSTLESKCSKNQEKALEDRILLLETRYQLEVDDQKKSFDSQKEQFLLKITQLEEKLAASEEEKKAAAKKQKALVKELQKTLKEERKRADSYERKSEERAGWHVVAQENQDGQSSHTFDGAESVSSLSAIESENVELITRLATLQKIHSENADTILQLESENSRLRREVTEKGELIESLIREKPLGTGFQSQPGYPANQPKLEVSFRKLLTTLGQDSSTHDVREMNKKLQRMLEETLSKNIILQRDIQTLMERTGL